MMDDDFKMGRDDKEKIIGFLQTLINEIEDDKYVVDNLSLSIENEPITYGNMVVNWIELYRKLTIIYRIN